MSTASAAPGKAARAKSSKPRKKQVRVPARIRADGDNPGNRHWRTYFLEHLVETSNVTAAAKYAHVVPSRAYRTRQEDPHFAAQWLAALAQGYQNLEMELLGYLRDPEPGHKMDVANAIRLLTLHRQSVAHQRAAEDDRSEEEVLASINRTIDEMRQRAAANAALLAEPDTGHEGD